MIARHISLFVHPGKTAEVVHILTGLNQGGLVEVVATADLSLIERHYHGFQLWKHFTGYQGLPPPKDVCDCNLQIKTLPFIKMYTKFEYRAEVCYIFSRYLAWYLMVPLMVSAVLYGVFFMFPRYFL